MGAEREIDFFKARGFFAVVELSAARAVILRRFLRLKGAIDGSGPP